MTVANAISCHRCGRAFDPERAELDKWLSLDAREDNWMLVVCRDCETRRERQRMESLRQPVLRRLR